MNIDRPHTWLDVVEADRRLRSDAVTAFAELQLRRRRASGLAALACVGVVVAALAVMAWMGI